jgi:hypothetical protein
MKKDVAEHRLVRVRRLLWAGIALMLVATPLAAAQRIIGRITGIDLPARVIEIDRVSNTLRGDAARLEPAADVGRYVLFEYHGRTVQVIRVLERGSVD